MFLSRGARILHRNAEAHAQIWRRLLHWSSNQRTFSWWIQVESFLISREVLGLLRSASKVFRSVLQFTLCIFCYLKLRFQLHLRSKLLLFACLHDSSAFGTESYLCFCIQLQILVGAVPLERADHRNRLCTVGGSKAKSTGFREEATHFWVSSALTVPIGEEDLGLLAR